MEQRTFLKTNDMVILALFSSLIAIGAFIKIPFFVVPFTLQFLFSNLAGLILGKKKGAMAVGIYLVLGLIGLPVFTEGGGIFYVLKPTFGYLVGFLVGAFAAGAITEKSKGQKFSNLLFASIVNLVIVYFFGVTYFYFLAKFYLGPIPLSKLIMIGAVVFIPSDLFLSVISSVIAKKIIPLRNRG